jgi:hypothetical protein
LVFIADAAKMEEKRASLTGIAGEVECTPDAAAKDGATTSQDGITHGAGNGRMQRTKRCTVSALQRTRSE